MSCSSQTHTCYKFQKRVAHWRERQTFGDTAEGAAASIVLFLVVTHAAFRSVRTAGLAQVDGVGTVWVVVFRQDAGNTALTEVLSCWHTTSTRPSVNSVAVVVGDWASQTHKQNNS